MGNLTLVALGAKLVGFVLRLLNIRLDKKEASKDDTTRALDAERRAHEAKDRAASDRRDPDDRLRDLGGLRDDR